MGWFQVNWPANNKMERGEEIMSDKTRPPFAIVEMEPINKKGLRGARRDIETIMGKRNRIEIGTPSCLEEMEPFDESILTAEDLKEFTTKNHSFYKLTLSLTLKPDKGCRFRNADFIIDFSNTVGSLPLILRLKPSESTYRKIVIEEKNKNLKFTLLPILKISDAELGSSSIRREEIEQIEVGMEIFGVRTKQAGWRFKLTDSREIPLSTTDLDALIVMPRESRTTAQFRIQATIDILSAVDKWLTLGFKRKEDQAVELSYDVPPNL